MAIFADDVGGLFAGLVSSTGTAERGVSWSDEVLQQSAFGWRLGNYSCPLSGAYRQRRAAKAYYRACW